MRHIDRSITVIIEVAMVLSGQFITETAQAQPSTFQQRLTALRLQNAYQQQQTTLQAAVQQTNMLVQSALRQDAAMEPAGFFSPLNFQQQQSALQMALQQTTATSEVAMLSKTRPSQSALLQISTLQAALQTTAAIETASQIQNDQLTPDQVQSLFNEQASLANLLAFPPPQPAGAARNK
ncbi:MAG TPA: hypothetical protein VGJ04_07890 [Pirellulales bacterium]|jgi:hypothetical protein